MQHQMQSIAQLDETDRQIRGEKMSCEYLKRLKEARTVYREDLIDCVRQCTWYVDTPAINGRSNRTCGAYKLSYLLMLVSNNISLNMFLCYAHIYTMH